MNTIMIWINILFLLVLTSCGSTPPEKRICSVVKHQYDLLYQVQINKKPLNEQWYLYDDAVEIAKDLAAKKKCQPLPDM